jgi:anti-sigma-K factor RskA
MGPEAIHDLTSAYALDALDADEAHEFEEHMRHCAQCQSELADLQEVTAVLAYAAPPAAAAPALRGRILEKARAERSNVIPFPRAQVQAPARRRTTWILGAAAAAAAAVAIGLGIWAAPLQNDLSAERSAHSRLAQALAIAASPGSAHVDLTGANGSLAVAPSGRGVLVIPELEKAPAGKTYEAWVIRGSKPSPAGLFRGGGSTVVPLSRRVSHGSVVAVTVEPKGGMPMPTTTPFITAKLS